MVKGRYNKIILEPHEVSFIQNNFEKMTNQQIADSLGIKITKLRAFTREMGLKRMVLEYWTDEQVQFLKEHYKNIGDTELAEIFEIKWYKAKGWTKKHIEKKRRYLKLKRTDFQRKKIKKRNTLMGRFAMCAKKRWLKTGQTKIGTKHIWHHVDNTPFVVIKTTQGFVHYNRWLWEYHNGKIPEGMLVRIMSDDKINYTIDDLQLVSKAQHAMLNTKNRVPTELKETIKLLNKLNKVITQKTV